MQTIVLRDDQNPQRRMTWGADLAISRLVGQHLRGSLVRCNQKKQKARQLLIIAIGEKELETSASIEIVKHTLLSGGRPDRAFLDQAL